jgi:hypothetical protein
MLNFAIAVYVTVDPLCLVLFATEAVKLVFWVAKAYLVIKQIEKSRKLNK